MPDVEEFLSARNIAYKLHLTTHNAMAPELIREHLDESYTDILVVGGDGTFHEVINGMPHFDINVGVIQSGTGNDFSKALGKSLTMSQQIERAVMAEPKPIDLGLCNEMLFHNGVGIGFDGKVAHRANELKAEQKGSVLSYYQAIAEAIATYKPVPLTIKGVKETTDIKTFMITVANGVAFGGGLRVTPKASVIDGELDVCCIDEVSVLGRLWRLPILLAGKHTQLNKVSYFKTKNIEIEASHEVPAHIDGEIFTGKQFKIGLAPQKLLLRY